MILSSFPGFMKTVLSSWAKCLFKFVAHFKNWVVVVFLSLALFINAQNWRQHKYPPIGRWINKIWSTCTMIFSAIKKNELLIHSTVMLSGRWEVQKAICTMILLIWHLGKGETIGAGTRSRVRTRGQVFPRSSLGIVLPAPILLYSCLCFQLWVSNTEIQAWSFSSFNHGSCQSAGISSGRLFLFLGGLCLLQAFSAPASPYNSAFQREQARVLTREAVEQMTFQNWMLRWFSEDHSSWERENYWVRCGEEGKSTLLIVLIRLLSLFWGNTHTPCLGLGNIFHYKDCGCTHLL